MRGYFIATRWSFSMQNLVVQALAMRQLGRLNPRHMLAAGYGLGQTEWCPRTIHTRQLWGCPAHPAAGRHRPAPCGRDAAGSWSVQCLRFKSSKRKGASRAAQEADHDEEEEEEDKRDPEDSDYEEEADEDPNVPKDYKDMEKYVQSFRYDVIMKAGLDMARNKIEDNFYGSKLRLNGRALIKKSKVVKVGDTLDLVLSEDREADTVTLMRIVLRKVLGESNDGEKHRVSLRRWKSLELPKDEAFKP